MATTPHSSLTGADLHEPKPHAASHANGGADELAFDASQITTGVIATARLGSGTADGTTFLRGDGAYAAPSGGSGGGGFPSMKTGRYYDMTFNWSATVAASAITANRLYAAPIFVPESTTFDRIAAHVTTAGGAGTLLRLGIYNAGSDGLPSTLLLDAGTVAADVPNSLREITISQVLPAGLYWLVMVSDGTATVYGYSACPFNILGGSSVGTGATNYAVYGTHAFAALPANFPAVTYGHPYKVALRAA